MSKLNDNVLRDSEAKEILLVCGHSTKGQPIATFADGRALYECPKGCKTVYAKKRAH